jgi:hypothetical protein
MYDVFAYFVKKDMEQQKLSKINVYCPDKYGINTKAIECHLLGDWIILFREHHHISDAEVDNILNDTAQLRLVRAGTDIDDALSFATFSLDRLAVIFVMPGEEILRSRERPKNFSI